MTMINQHYLELCKQLYQLTTLFTQQKNTKKISAIYPHNDAIVILIKCNVIMPIVITRENLVQNIVKMQYFNVCICATSLTTAPIKNASSENIAVILLICLRV